MSTDYNYRLKAGLNGLGCSALSFSALAVPPLTRRKISQQLVSQILAGTKEFDSPEDARDFLEVVASMQHLQEIVQPRVPINWSNVLDLKDVLATVHEQRKNDLDPITVQNFYLRLTRLNFFAGLRSDGSVIETINPEKEAAAFHSIALAEKAITRLKQMGVTAYLERLTGPRRRSTIVTSLSELRFEDEQPAIEDQNEQAA